MAVKDWMAIDPVVVGPDDTVHEARALLRDRGVRHLPVVYDGRLIGIISDRDVSIDDRSLRRLEAMERIGEAVGEGTPVEAVMSTSVHTCDPEASVGDAARLMLSRRISALPVVSDGALVGIITTTDCLLAALTTDADLEPPPLAPVTGPGT
ncbi:MAG TPA: CBS domain-containing protein [Euzebya sp.]|nr:CBS domain-containing protein [Euzebya sp.]